MKFNSDFKYDLELGEMAETDFHQMLSEKKIEIKYDRKTKETGNIFIEFQSRNKLSGISTTQADFWTYYIDDDFCITISTKNMDGCFLVDRTAEVCITAIDCTGKFGVVYEEFQKTFFTLLEK